MQTGFILRNEAPQEHVSAGKRKHDGCRQLILRPVAAVEGAVLDGVSEMSNGEAIGAFAVGVGAGDFENAVAGTRGASFLHGALEQALSIRSQLLMGANLAGGHLGVGVDSSLASLMRWR